MFHRSVGLSPTGRRGGGGWFIGIVSGCGDESAGGCKGKTAVLFVSVVRSLRDNSLS